MVVPTVEGPADAPLRRGGDGTGATGNFSGIQIMSDRPREPSYSEAPDMVQVLSRDEIQQRVAEVARRISEDYQGERPLLIGILKGAFVFLSDLIRCLTIPVEIDFIRLASYGTGLASSGNVAFCSDIPADLRGKDLLIVEDIIDTGLTMKKLVEHLERCEPKSIRVCTLIDKYERREIAFEADYVCQTVSSGFLVGYGLDYAEQYRYLPAIYELKF
jgi:hypoxanthine phosphoribosyltransferase